MTYVNAPIHDLLIRIKNAYKARKSSISSVPYSNFKLDILNLLKQYGFISDMEVNEDGLKKYISIKLNNIDPKGDAVPVIKFYSKPSRPWYISYKNITNVAGGKGIGILSTNKGLMASHVAKKQKLGGELIAEIY